jgi:nucleoside-diphosphate-sugar epimerase
MESLNGKKVLVTGGAGFIGSNLTESLLELGAIVTVFDNLETGRKSNIEEFLDHPNFRFIEGDLRNYDDCVNAVQGINAISHQAALGSVPRSIEFPHNTHAVNATGFLNMLHAAKENGVKRFVYASSSSVYGDSLISPKTIGSEGNLLSPYAVTKKLNEQYASVYALLHQMETIGLRYFNVFGPKQDPHGVYAAAIPKFIEKMVTGGEIVINGDGGQTRDFTFVKNAVNANILGLSTSNSEAFGNVFNVACGEYFSLNDVVKEIKIGLEKLNKYDDSSTVVHGPDRPGDIRDSLADISKTMSNLGYKNPVLFKEGMEIYLKSMFRELN